MSRKNVNKLLIIIIKFKSSTFRVLELFCFVLAESDETTDDAALLLLLLLFLLSKNMEKKELN